MENIVKAANEFQDWELLPSDPTSKPNPNSNSDSNHDLPPVNAVESADTFDEIGPGGLIKANYFSSEPQNRSYLEDLDDNKSARSDNPSWIDPGSDENPIRYLNKESGGSWSDSSSEQSDDRKIGDMVGKNETAFPENDVKRADFKKNGEILDEKMEKKVDLTRFCSDSVGFEGDPVKFNGFAENSDVGTRRNTSLHDEVEALGEEKLQYESIGNVGEVAQGNGNKKSGEIEKRGVGWWRMPMEFLKYCVFRMSPVWTVSVAAAVMGFVILGRRLYKMKKKTKGLEIKVTFDDKKASQVMSRAARLNEAFSVVKRVPVIRPSVPAVGVATWPVMSLR